MSKPSRSFRKRWIFKKVLGSEHPNTATGLDTLGEVYWATGDYTKAEPLYQEALRIQRKVLGSEQLDTSTTLNDLGELYWATGDYVKAEPILQEALRIRQKFLGQNILTRP